VIVRVLLTFAVGVTLGVLAGSAWLQPLGSGSGISSTRPAEPAPVGRTVVSAPAATAVDRPAGRAAADPASGSIPGVDPGGVARVATAVEDRGAPLARPVPRTRSPFADGPAFAAGGEPLVCDLLLRFPAGDFLLDEARLRGAPGDAFPTDVVLEGAGMDGTRLRLSDLSPPGDVLRLTLRDLTLDTQGGALVDLPSGRLELSLQRVRVVGFDGGRGRPLFAARGGYRVEMEGGELLGGLGRAPGLGAVFGLPADALLGDMRRSHGAPAARKALARFYGVRLQWLDAGFRHLDDGLFLDCRFEQLQPTGPLGSPLLGSERCAFRDCRFEPSLTSSR